MNMQGIEIMDTNNESQLASQLSNNTTNNSNYKSGATTSIMTNNMDASNIRQMTSVSAVSAVALNSGSIDRDMEATTNIYSNTSAQSNESENSSRVSTPRNINNKFRAGSVSSVTGDTNIYNTRFGTNPPPPMSPQSQESPDLENGTPNSELQDIEISDDHDNNNNNNTLKNKKKIKKKSKQIDKSRSLSRSVTVANVNQEDLYHKGHNNATAKLVVWIFYTLLFPSLAYIFDDSSHSDNSGTIISIVFLINSLIFWALFGLGVFSAKKLHRIQSLLAYHESLGITTFCYGLKEDVTQPIESISELLALQGTYYPIISGTFASTTLMLISLGILRVWSKLFIDNVEDGGIPGGYLGALLCYTQICGYRLLNQFELNYRDSVHVFGHYIGFIIMAAGSFSMGVLYNWSIFSLCWCLFVVPCLAIWLILPYIIRIDKDNPDPKKVHQLSKWCLFFEFAYCVQSSTSMFLYLFAIRNY